MGSFSPTEPVVEPPLKRNELPLVAIELRPGSQFAQARKDHVQKIEKLCTDNPPSEITKKMMFDDLSFYCYSGKFGEAILSEIEKDSAVVITIDRGVPVVNAANEARTTTNWGLSAMTNCNLPNWICPSNGGAGIDIYIVDVGFGSNPAADYEFQGKENDIKVLLADPPGTTVTHGLRVAQLAGGVHIGAAPKSKLYLLSIQNDEPNEENSNLALQALTEAWSYMLEAMESRYPKYSVVNCSWGIDVQGDKGKTLQRFFETISKYTIVVCAAGNDGAEVQPVRIPAGLGGNDTGGVTTVGSSNSDEQVHGRSSWGAKVDFYAPGVNLEFRDPAGLNPFCKSGTSYASPMIAGIYACWMGEAKARPRPKAMTQADLKFLIFLNAKQIRAAAGSGFVSIVRLLIKPDPTPKKAFSALTETGRPHLVHGFVSKRVAIAT